MTDHASASRFPPLAITDHVPGLLGRNVAFWRGDLTRLRAGAVLNAANSGMLGCFAPGHRCIDNIIHAVAGPALRAECARYMTWAETFDPTRRQGGEPAGRAVFTGGYHLPAQHVIHSVGPVIEDGRKPTLHDRRLLSSCYTSVLNVAHAAGLGSVGLCSLSTGVFGYPKRQAALVTLEAIGRWLAAHPDSRMRIVISLNADVDVAAYEAAHSSVTPAQAATHDFANCTEANEAAFKIARLTGRGRVLAAERGFLRLRLPGRHTVPEKRMDQGQGLEGHGREGEGVGEAVHAAAPGIHFRRREPGGHHLFTERTGRVPQVVRIDQRHLPVLGAQHVRRRRVAVHQATAVEFSQDAGRAGQHMKAPAEASRLDVPRPRRP